MYIENILPVKCRSITLKKMHGFYYMKDFLHIQSEIITKIKSFYPLNPEILTILIQTRRISPPFPLLIYNEKIHEASSMDFFVIPAKQRAKWTYCHVYLAAAAGFLTQSCKPASYFRYAAAFHRSSFLNCRIVVSLSIYTASIPIAFAQSPICSEVRS